ncbi:MAG: hypothetical protein H7301_02145 [Cryobacterium sp.]|nr:hypothetical protein [Oligoflexia bacterium]
MPQKIRKEWIQSCEFHPHTNLEVLRQVHQGIEKKVTSGGALPVLLLDLDSTLYEVGPRSGHILKEWVDSKESQNFKSVRDRVSKLKPSEIGYSLLDTFTGMGLSVGDPEVESALHSANHFWAARFFTNDYLDYDHAYPGASDFVKKAYELGAEIIYLTGRDEPGMGKGTRKRLIADGFPFDSERTHLLLKRSFELDDLEHKSKAADYVRDIGSLVASFENEPPNLVALSDLFPESMHVFMDSVYSDRPALPKPGFYRITGFTA